MSLSKLYEIGVLIDPIPYIIIENDLNCKLKCLVCNSKNYKPKIFIKYPYPRTSIFNSFNKNDYECDQGHKFQLNWYQHIISST